MPSQSVLTRLRKTCAPLPEVHETETFGNPTFRAGSKTFAVLDSYEGKPCIVFKTTLPTQKALCRSKSFFRSPFGAKHGWTGVWVEPGLEWNQLEDLLVQSYRLVALKRMLKALDSH